MSTSRRRCATKKGESGPAPFDSVIKTFVSRRRRHDVENAWKGRHVVRQIRQTAQQRGPSLATALRQLDDRLMEPESRTKWLWRTAEEGSNCGTPEYPFSRIHLLSQPCNHPFLLNGTTETIKRLGSKERKPLTNSVTNFVSQVSYNPAWSDVGTGSWRSSYCFGQLWI